MISAEVIDQLAQELVELIGERQVVRSQAALDRASIDGSYLSPILMSKMPLGEAQLVALPTTAEQIALTVGAAVRHGVPITPRGKGTGNYGQGIPMDGGLVLDTTRARSILSIDEGRLTADAGVSMLALEQAAVKTEQELMFYPSTIQSTLGGFLAGGSGGTGSVEHGVIMRGWVTSLDVVYAVPDAKLVHLEGSEAEKHLHRYGTTAIIARATVRLEPRRDWNAFYATFDDFHDAFRALRELSGIVPTPRLVSADIPRLAGALPENPGIVAGKASLRAILAPEAVPVASAVVAAHGGQVSLVEQGLQQTVKVSMISYNHAIEWLQKSEPGVYFHVEVNGDALIDRIDEVHQVWEGAMLHIEAQKGRPIGMLAGRFESEQDVYAGFERLSAIGVGFHNPHQWFVDWGPDEARKIAAETDPNGLLNPGKLVEPNVVTGTKTVTAGAAK